MIMEKYTSSAIPECCIKCNVQVSCIEDTLTNMECNFCDVPYIVLEEKRKEEEKIRKKEKWFGDNMNDEVKVTNMRFSTVLECFRDYPDINLHFQRRGWNGEGMYIKLQLPDENSKMTVPYIYMKTATGDFVPWCPSQMDIFADDWIQICPPHLKKFQQ